MISATRVHEIFLDCLHRQTPEDSDPCIGIYDVKHVIGFVPSKIEEHREEIYQILQELPDPFFEDIGGGYSFMQLPFTKTGEQWGEQTNGNELMGLGLATGYMQYMFSIQMWSALPGRVPYIILFREPKPVKVITCGELKSNVYSITGAWEKLEEDKDNEQH